MLLCISFILGLALASNSSSSSFTSRSPVPISPSDGSSSAPTASSSNVSHSATAPSIEQFDASDSDLYDDDDDGPKDRLHRFAKHTFKLAIVCVCGVAFLVLVLAFFWAIVSIGWKSMKSGCAKPSQDAEFGSRRSEDLMGRGFVILATIPCFAQECDAPCCGYLPQGGNGFCYDGYCCSESGFCGIGEYYCGNGCQREFGDCYDF
ncbi:hypothetical protein SELMODRAFT_419028 [Selaginella moellendorffii]|uniref:Chitin-binding type-1 domain-containing protein n=1 Tax=Selaginella moellendorffii TaxID=88036 RepID=D8S7K8_SELML|nr:hypothetical protein SELMODRAFT_419028 [Selaginella moellendorffii]